MKTKLVLGSLLALSGMLQAQTWAGSGVSTGNAYRSGNVGIGNTSPGFLLHVSTTGAVPFLVERTIGQINGLKIFFTSNPATGIGIGSGSTIFQNQASSSSDILFMPTPSLGAMIIKDNGKVGIGTISPSSDCRLKVEDVATSATTYIGASSSINSTGSGVQASTNIGVKGVSSDGDDNSGGYFEASGSNASNYGVQGYATSGPLNIGGFFSAGSAANSYGMEAVGEDYAGYFLGNVTRTGTDNFTSDRKLKTNIQPLTGALDKIKLLQPSTYLFKTEEYQAMNLPKGKQFGLIAQELEEVFPELVSNMNASSYKDEKGNVMSVPEYKTVQYISLIPVLIAGIKEQQQKIEDQTKVNDELKNLTAIQQQQINELLSRSSNATGINSVNNQIDGFNMEQNIPNPFSNETVIRYSLPQTVSTAYMAVYDLSGKQINSFPLNQKGSSSITISSEKLAAGIYIYSIVADGKVMDSKRMVVAEKH